MLSIPFDAPWEQALFGGLYMRIATHGVSLLKLALDVNVFGGLPFQSLHTLLLTCVVCAIFTRDCSRSVQWADVLWSWIAACPPYTQ